jgi:hypothetical protein
MKFSKVLVACAIATTIAVPAWSQTANPGSPGEIPGYLSPSTNSFRPIYLPQVASDPSAVSVVTGKIVTNFAITIQSTIPTTTPIDCTVTAGVADGNILVPPFTIFNNILEQATVVATRTGSTAKCAVTIPYSWNLSSKATDKVQLTYTVIAQSNSATQAPGTLINRNSSQTIATIGIPAAGATTTETVKATI